MQTLIGSRAITSFFRDEFRDTSKSDWDYHASSDDAISLWFDPRPKNIDVFVDPRLAQWNWGEVATPDEMLTMKISHGYWDIHGTWDKHAADIAFLQRHGARFIPELHDILLPIWKERYKKNPISLNKSAKEFFTDHVHYIYVHDTVHESVAYRHRPWYLEFLKDGSDVMVDNSKFFGLPLESRLQAIREELYVIALERILIPNNYRGSKIGAYRWALRRTATSLFKNRWATELLVNLDALWRPDVDFVARHRANAHMLVPMEGK